MPCVMLHNTFMVCYVSSAGLGVASGSIALTCGGAWVTAWPLTARGAAMSAGSEKNGCGNIMGFECFFTCIQVRGERFGPQPTSPQFRTNLKEVVED